MNNKYTELSNLSYAEIIEYKQKLETEKEELQQDIIDSEEAIKDCEKRGDYSSRSDFRQDIYNDNEQIGRIEFKLKEINAYMANIYVKAEMLSKNINIELTEAEANTIIDMYSSLKEKYIDEINYSKESIENHGNSNNYEFDDELEELYDDLKFSQEQFDKYELIINKASNELTKKLK